VTAPAGLTRRLFLKTSAGLVVGFAVVPRNSWGLAETGPAKPLPEPNAFLRIGPDESVTVLLSHSEMGQGIWTTLPMLLAEELECDWTKIRVEHAPAAPPYAHTVYGVQMTGGSTSTWSEFDRYRQVGALAREMLIRAAAARWQVDPSACRTEAGYVVGPKGKLSFGQLASAAEQVARPTTVRLKEAKDWTILGKPTKRLDSPEKVTGKAQFGMDVALPGQLTAVVARSPVFGGKVKSVSDARAKAVPGVKAVVQVPSGVAVVAENFWAAKLGRAALDVEWEPGAGAALETDRMREEFRGLLPTPGAVAASEGDVEAGLRSAARSLEAEYEFPYLAHAPMEPLNCTVRLAPDSAEVWTGTQFQTMDQGQTAAILGLKPEQVKIHTTFLGGGFGRRATPTSDFVTEAAHVAKATAALGAPVKVVWTREDDIRGGYYRPMFLHRVKVGVGPDGLPTAWKHALAGQSILEGTPFASAMIKNGVDATSVEGVADSPYLAGIKDRRVDLHSPKTPIPVLWLRSVGHTHTAYVMETLVDELAHGAGQDPLAYRRTLLQAHPRHLGVLELVAQKAGWGTPLPAGLKRGLAVHESFGSVVAQVAEVRVEGDRIKVDRVVAALDCGVCVNPAGARAQIEGGIVFGLTAALHGELTLKGGGVEQSNFHDYPILRMSEMPRIEVHIAPSTLKSGGVGEVGVPPVAPAVANAVFAATGKRLRRLPMRLA
jgi:isoquinoline 1-oxidoreductase beta subunit